MWKSRAWNGWVIPLIAAFALSGCAKVRLLRKSLNAVSTHPTTPSINTSPTNTSPPATGTTIVSGGGFSSNASMQAMISVGAPVSSVVATGSGVNAYLGPQGIFVTP